MYKLMFIFSFIIRQYFIANPFEALGDGLTVNIGESSTLLSPWMLNIIAEPFIHLATYGIVGFYYERGEEPLVGSILYLIFYCVHIFLLWLTSLTGFAMWAIVLIVIIYVGLHIALFRLKNFDSIK